MRWSIILRNLGLKHTRIRDIGKSRQENQLEGSISGVRRIFERGGRRAGNLKTIKTKKKILRSESVRFSAQN